MSKNNLWILIALFIAAAFAVVVFTSAHKPAAIPVDNGSGIPVDDGAGIGGGSGSPPEPVFCTQDAKLCADGSYVARHGPNCEFDPCPGPLNPVR